jgi:hypothetical protein
MAQFAKERSYSDLSIRGQIVTPKCSCYVLSNACPRVKFSLVVLRDGFRYGDAGLTMIAH